LLLKVGVGMMSLAVVLAIGVAVVISMQGETSGRQALSAEPPPETTVETALVEEPEAEEPEARPEPEPSPRETEEGWQLPDEGEAQAAGEPRYYDPNSNAAMTLSVPALGVRGAPVFDSDAPQALDSGVAHVPETSMPWDGGAQRNVYLAAHRLGYEGTGSRLLFYELDRLGKGDEVVLEGRGGTYRYRVTEKLVVDPWDSWVMGQVRGRDMVSLQTCTPIPTFERRLVVRADRI